MITEELLQFIRTQLSAGETRESITAKLVTEGNWSEPDVDKAFSALQEGVTTEEPIPMSTAPDTATGFGNPSESVYVEQGKQEQGGGGHTKRTTSFLPVLAVGAVLMIGVVLFVVFGPMLGSRHSMAKDIDGFVESFARAMQDIERFEYQVSLDMTQEPQDGSVEMLTITDSKYASQKEVVERDVELFDDARSLSSALQGFNSRNGRFPTSTSEPAFVQNQSFYLERIDRERLGRLNYRVTGGGENYALTVQFETKEMLQYLEEYYGDDSSTAPVFNYDALTVALEKDITLPYYVSLAQVLKKNPLIEGLEMINFYAQSLPARYKADVAFSGVVGVEQGEGNIPDTENVFALNVDWGDLAFSVDAGLLVKDDEVFAKVDRFPSLFFIDIEPIRGKWVNLSIDDLSSTMFWDVSDAELNEAKEELEKVPQIIAEAIAEHNPFLFTKSPRVETTESGGGAVVYSLGIDKDNVVGFLESLRAKFLALSIIDDEEEFQRETEELIAFFETEEFAKVVEYLNKYATFEVWMDQKTGYPVQYVQELVFVPNPEMMEESFPFFGSTAAPKDTQLRNRSVLSLTKINESITIQKPSSSISLEEATALITGREYNAEEVEARAEDTKVRAALNNLRAPAELYYDANGESYLGVCSTSDSNGLATSIKELKDEVPTSNPKCFDSATAYAAQARLTDGSLQCVDSTGAVRTTPSGEPVASGTSCY